MGGQKPHRKGQDGALAISGKKNNINL